MKKKLIIITFIIIGLLPGLRAGGIQFLNDTIFENVLKLAQQEQKMIFIDCYAVWCGPCNFMFREIFPDEKVGEFHNKNFINLKYDMEQPYGMKIREKYEVKGFPTYLYLSPEGELIHRGIGATRDAESFLEISKTALSGDNSFKVIAERVRKGDRTASTLLEYLNLNFRAPETEQIITEHFRIVADEEKFSEASWKLFNEHLNVIDSEPFRFFLDNRAKYAELFGAKAVEDKLYNAFSAVFRASPETYEQLETIDPELFQRNKLEMAYRGPSGRFIRDKTNAEHWKDMVAGAEVFINGGHVTPIQLNSIAWIIYENYEQFNDRNALRKAEQWSKQTLSAEPGNPVFNNTYAHILFAMGNRRAAITQQEKAVALAKSTGSANLARYEESLQRFRARR